VTWRLSILKKGNFVLAVAALDVLNIVLLQGFIVLLFTLLCIVPLLLVVVLVLLVLLQVLAQELLAGDLGAHEGAWGEVIGVCWRGGNGFLRVGRGGGGIRDSRCAFAYFPT
jgi:hypothetical protein